MACNHGRPKMYVKPFPPYAAHTRRTKAGYQIIYTVIVGIIMLAALLEWFLWIAAFMYCVWKVFRKAEHWSINVLAVVVGIAFCLFR
jgi:hypothetical protein